MCPVDRDLSVSHFSKLPLTFPFLSFFPLGGPLVPLHRQDCTMASILQNYGIKNLSTADTPPAPEWVPGTIKSFTDHHPITTPTLHKSPSGTSLTQSIVYGATNFFPPIVLPDSAGENDLSRRIGPVWPQRKFQDDRGHRFRGCLLLQSICPAS